MPEITFFFSVDDPSLVLEGIAPGNYLLVNKHYDENEDLIVLSTASKADTCSFSRFFVLPDDQFISEISISNVTKDGGEKFYYIRDRVGAGAIDLILYSRPSEGEVCVGSLGFHVRTYRSVNEPLEPRPPVFSSAFRSLSSFIKRSAQPVPNKLFPKTVYVFPQAMALLRQDFSRPRGHRSRLETE